MRVSIVRWSGLKAMGRWWLVPIVVVVVVPEDRKGNKTEPDRTEPNQTTFSCIVYAWKEMCKCKGAM